MTGNVTARADTAARDPKRDMAAQIAATAITTMTAGAMTIAGRAITAPTRANATTKGEIIGTMSLVIVANTPTQMRDGLMTKGTVKTIVGMRIAIATMTAARHAIQTGGTIADTKKGRRSHGVLFCPRKHRLLEKSAEEQHAVTTDSDEADAGKDQPHNHFISRNLMSRVAIDIRYTHFLLRTSGILHEPILGQHR